MLSFFAISVSHASFWILIHCQRPLQKWLRSLQFVDTDPQVLKFVFLWVSRQTLPRRKTCIMEGILLYIFRCFKRRSPLLKLKLEARALSRYFKDRSKNCLEFPKEQKPKGSEGKSDLWRHWWCQIKPGLYVCCQNEINLVVRTIDAYRLDDESNNNSYATWGHSGIFVHSSWFQKSIKTDFNCMDENWLVISFTVDKLFVLGLVYNTQGFQAVKKILYAH